METTKGRRHRIRCPHCKMPEGHETVEQVFHCAAQLAEQEADAKAEYEAMKREEAYWENGGPHAEQIAWEHDEDMRRGWS